jgi:ferredoxin-NADP reductase
MPSMVGAAAPFDHRSREWTFAGRDATQVVLESVRPRDLARWTALICGPPAMVADTAAALPRLGMPRAAIQTEGFE